MLEIGRNFRFAVQIQKPGQRINVNSTTYSSTYLMKKRGVRYFNIATAYRYQVILTNPVIMKTASKWCLGNVNIETPMYENMKFSAKKFRSSNISLVRVREFSDKLLKV